MKDIVSGEGRNSILFKGKEKHIFYEKLSNSIHVGDKKELDNLQEKVESINYMPYFENESLKSKKGEGLEGLVLNVTENCNLRCNYCINSGLYENEKVINKSDMSEDIAKKAVDLFVPKSKKPVLISFYGGEPSLNMGLIKNVVDYSKERHKERDLRFSMTTNFYNINFKDIFDREIDMVISLDGPKEIHDKNRIHKSGRPTWEKIMNNLQSFENKYPGYINRHAGINATCANPGDLEEIIDFFKNQDLNVFRIGSIEKKGLGKNIFINSKRDPLQKVMNDFLDIVINKEVIPDAYRTLFEQQLSMMTRRSKQKMPDQIKLQGACYPGQRKLFVDTEGQFYMCEKLGKRLPIGNIEEGIEEKRADAAVDRFTEIRNSVCRDCWAQRICSPCIHSAKDPRRDISVGGLRETCSDSKSELLTTLNLYIELSKFKEGEEYLHTINLNK